MDGRALLGNRKGIGGNKITIPPMYSRTRAHSIRWDQCQHVQLTVKLLLPFFFFVFRDLVIRIRELRVVNLFRKKKPPKTLPVGCCLRMQITLLRVRPLLHYFIWRSSTTDVVLSCLATRRPSIKSLTCLCHLDCYSVTHGEQRRQRRLRLMEHYHRSQ